MYTDSVKRVFCRITVFGSVTYRCRTFTGSPTILLHPVCRQFSRIQFSQKTEARLKSIDKVPSEYALIYRAPMTSLMQVAQVMSCVSILSLGAVGIYKYSDLTSNFPLTYKMNEFSKLGRIEIDGELFTWVTMFIIFNVGMCAVTLKYPLRIYHHEAANSYICVLNRFLPFKTKNISFNAGDIRRHIPFMSSLIPWRDALFKVGNKTMYIMENNFRTPADFSTMFCKV